MNVQCYIPCLDLFLNRCHDEPLGGIRHVRRIPHPGRGGGTRTRRANMHYQTAGNALSGLSSSSRETMDPIAGEKQTDSVSTDRTSFSNLPGAKTIKKTTNLTQNKSQTQRARATTCKTRPAGRVRLATRFCPVREMFLNYNGNRPAACHRPSLQHVSGLSCLSFYRLKTFVLNNAHFRQRSLERTMDYGF